MQIEIGGSMYQAWLTECSGYTPVVEGINLAVEISDPITSLNNLMLLTDSGRQVAAIQVRPSGVLVVFTSGESYLATGFTLGIPEPGCDHPVRYLSKFCARIWGGKPQAWLEFLGSEAYGDDYTGPIDPSLVPR